ncbi:hypothetical protein K9M47_02650 [Candidatus Gracilibacteria bacterium]|nr:hypothetical protein [Candidatus Gracilibacteria bacterium]
MEDEVVEIIEKIKPTPSFFVWLIQRVGYFILWIGSFVVVSFLGVFFIANFGGFVALIFVIVGSFLFLRYLINSFDDNSVITEEIKKSWYDKVYSDKQLAFIIFFLLFVTEMCWLYISLMNSFPHN